jgi:hypothetical protein
LRLHNRDLRITIFQVIKLIFQQNDEGNRRTLKPPQEGKEKTLGEERGVIIYNNELPLAVYYAVHIPISNQNYCTILSGAFRGKKIARKLIRG